MGVLELAVNDVPAPFAYATVATVGAKAVISIKVARTNESAFLLKVFFRFSILLCVSLRYDIGNDCK